MDGAAQTTTTTAHCRLHNITSEIQFRSILAALRSKIYPTQWHHPRFESSHEPRILKANTALRDGGKTTTNAWPFTCLKVYRLCWESKLLFSPALECTLSLYSLKFNWANTSAFLHLRTAVFSASTWLMPHLRLILIGTWSHSSITHFIIFPVLETKLVHQNGSDAFPGEMKK